MWVIRFRGRDIPSLSEDVLTQRQELVDISGERVAFGFWGGVGLLEGIVKVRA
jgi:hypothetical protein